MGLEPNEEFTGGKELNLFYETDELAGSAKVKSGKYARSNINIKIQEQWPHLNVLRKYTRRTSFEQLDFENLCGRGD